MPDREAMYQAYMAFATTKNRDPKSLEELTTGGFLKVPRPPPGKSFVLNLKTSPPSIDVR